MGSFNILWPFAILCHSCCFAQFQNFQRNDNDNANSRNQNQPQVFNGGILEYIKGFDDLSEFAKVLEIDGLHQAFLQRQISLFAPNNAAFRKFKGRRNENLILNHMTNIALTSDFFPEKLTSLVTGNPPLWISRTRTGYFVNQAKILRADIRLRSSRGDEQVLHIIDSVLEPLVPISIKDSEYFIQLDAFKLLTKSTLYDLGGHRMRVFNEQAELNRKSHMFGVGGQHTFFMPVDSAFDVSVQLSGHDHDRSRLKSWQPKRGKIRKELVDGRVLEGHIVPHRLLFTNQAPSQEFPTVAWLQDGIQVNVSLQLTSLQSTSDVTILGDDLIPDRGVVVRSNTIVGDFSHARGMVVARIVKGNIPVQNGVVHLIDKPLMVVAKTLYEYVMEEGRDPNNRLSKFAKLLRDKGGKFSDTIVEANDGTLLAPSDDAFDDVDQARFDFNLGNDYLRGEMLGLHFVRKKIVSTDFEIRKGGEQTFSVPASLANNRIWFYYNPHRQLMTVEGRGVNASVLEKDIGTINGVIHVIDKILGVPYKTVGQKLESDPNMSHMSSILKQLHMDHFFHENKMVQSGSRKFTLVVPSNEAWEKVRMHFSKAYNTLIEGQFPDYGKFVMERHFTMGDRPLIFEELVEMSRRNPRRTIPFLRSELTFTEQGEHKLDAYNDHFVQWMNITAKVIRKNIECSNGIIHMVDKVFINDAPPWSVGGQDRLFHQNLIHFLMISIISMLLLLK